MSTYMEMTQGTPTSDRKFTYSGWIKKSAPNASGDEQHIFSAGSSGDSHYNGIRFKTTGKLHINFDSTTPGTTTELIPTALFRDPGAWYHIVLAVDTEQSVSTDRMKLYINGVQETVFDTAVYPPEDHDCGFMASGKKMVLGRQASGSSQYFNGDMSWVQFVDGLQLAPTEFGEVDATAGIWKIKPTAYATPGDNGFCLKMEDRTNLDLDSSSNAHTFTSGGTPTATYDNPSNNFATLNLLDGNIINSGGLQNGGTTYNKSSTGVGHNSTTLSTLGVSAGKWYWEVKAPNATDGIVGFINSNHGAYHSTDNQLFGIDDNSYGWRVNGSRTVGSVTTTSYFNTYTDDDILSFAIDLDNGKCYAAKNGTWENSGDPTSGATGTGSFADPTLGLFYSPAVGNMNYNSATKFEVNYGNGYYGTTAVSSANADDAGIGAMEYDVPAGYYCLCTKNIKAYGG
jgi:hypothetical protein